MRFSGVGVVFFASWLTACGGGGGGASLAPPVQNLPTSAPTPGAPTPTPTPMGVPGNASALPPIPLGPNGGWGPYSVASALQFPVQSGYDGTGETVAVVGDYPPSLSDIQGYLSQFSIVGHHWTYSIENVNGGSLMTDTNGLGEATLDVETIAGLAPGAAIVFYSIPEPSNANLTNAYNQIAADGDSGDRCVANGLQYIGVSYPASDPNVIGVGGTENLAASCTALGSITSQQAWNDFCSVNGQQAATGGGVSAIFSLPTYQTGLGGASNSLRNIPDVAMPAEGVSIYLQGAWELASGTSWSAPQLAAMIAEIYEYCNTPLIPPSEIFYYVYGTKGYGAFLNVTAGNNRFAGDPTYYSAHAGFNNVSGIGVPLGMPVAQTVCPNRVPLSLRRATQGAVSLSTQAPAEPTLLQNVPNLRGLQDLGVRPAGTQTAIVLTLRPTPTVAEDEQRVIAHLTSAGFTIGKTYSNHLVVNAVGPSSLVSSYFDTQIHNFAQPGYGVRYANVSPVVIPASIAAYVQGVIIDNLIVTGAPPHRLRAMPNSARNGQVFH